MKLVTARRASVAFIAFALVLALPGFVAAGWKRVELATGASVCQDETSGAQFKPPYTSKADVTKACNVITSFLPWLGTAAAQTIAILPGVVSRPSVPPSPPPTLHAPWLECDVGSPVTAGTSSNSGGTMFVSGAGDVTQSNTFKGHFVYQPWTGPVEIITTAQAITGPFDWRKAGLFLADAQCSNSLWVAGSVTGNSNHGVGFNLSNTVNGRQESFATAGAQPPPQPIRLTWDGTVASVYYGPSLTGPWTLVDSETRAFTGTNYVGVFATSGSTTDPALSTVTFTEPTVNVFAVDPGSMSYTAPTQSVTEDASTFTICGSRGVGTDGAASYAVHDKGTGTATSADWTTSDLPQVLSWMAGEGGQKCTTPIHVTNRAGTQGSRTLIVNQTSVTGAIAGATTEQTITFLDAVTFTDNRVKWHPGYYLQNDRNATALKTQSVRFAMYDGSTVANNSHLTGVLYLAPWSQLEGATHGDYAAGFALIHAEINKLKGLAQPKRLIVMLFDEVNYSICGGQTCQDGYYPVYLKNAGCLVFGSGVWDVGSGINRFKRWNTTCQGYEADMLNAYGAEFDGEAYFEGWALTYETEVQGTIQTNGGFTEPAWDTGLAASATTARAAFPHSNIFFSGVNFAPQGGNATINAWFSTWSGLGVGWGNGDTCNYAGTEAGIYYPSDNITAGRQQVGGNWTANQSNDYRGQIPYVGKVETSELGENSVCGSPGYTGLRPSPNPSGYGSVFDHWDTVMHASHGLVEHNTWAGTSVQQWTNVANSLLDMVNTHPITHTSCPTIYNTKYGNGTAGSGCNLN